MPTGADPEPFPITVAQPEAGALRRRPKCAQPVGTDIRDSPRTEGAGAEAASSGASSPLLHPIDLRGSVCLTSARLDRLMGTMWIGRANWSATETVQSTAC